MTRGEPGIVPRLDVLDPARPADLDRWLGAWDAWPEADIHAHPGWVRWCAATGAAPRCALWQGPEGGVCLPFHLRDLSAEAWSDASLGPVADVTSPYGYGGAWRWGRVGAPHEAAFWPAWDAWLAEARVVSEFHRLALQPEAILAPPMPPEARQPNVVVDLRRPAAEAEAAYRPVVRRNLRRAQQRGVRVEVARGETGVSGFWPVYAGTMARRGVAASATLDAPALHALVEALPGRVVFFLAHLAGAVVSAELLLLGKTRAYFYLGGTDRAADDARPNDVLQHEVIAWCRAAGLHAYVLGGGVVAGDGIEAHKRGFAPDGVVPFRVSGRIHRPDAYARLVESRRAHAARGGTAWRPRPGWFPAYRA